MTRLEYESVMQAVTAALVGGRDLAQEALATFQDQVSGRSEAGETERIVPVGGSGSVTLSHDAMTLLAMAQHESGWRCIAYATGSGLEYDLTAR